MNKTTILLIVIGIGVAAGLFGVKSRVSVEDRNKRVETVIDYIDAVSLASAAHLPISQTLAKVKDAGVTTIAIPEDSLDTLRTAYEMGVQATGVNTTQLTFTPAFFFQEQRVEKYLTNKAGVAFKEQELAPYSEGQIIGGVAAPALIVQAPYSQIAGLGIGLDPEAVNTVLDADLLICPRPYNFVGATSQSIHWMLAQIAGQCLGRANVVIFNGPDVLGNRNLFDDTADALRQVHLLYGSNEFGKQVGDEELSRAGADITVRVHSIGGNEMPTMDEDTAIARFALAARERDIRVCYIRLFLNGLITEPDLLQSNLDFLKGVQRNIEDGGLTLGPSHPFTKDPLPARPLIALMALGVAAGFTYLVRQFTGIDGRAFYILLIVSALAAAGMAIRQHSPIGREGDALLAAMVFPSMGVLRFANRSSAVPTSDSKAAFWRAVAQMAAMTAWTVCGILLVVGLLADRTFLLKVNEFVGVRVAIVTPIVLTVLYYGLGLSSLPETASVRERWAALLAPWRRFMTSPLLIGQTVVGVMALALIVVVMIRSGNDPGVGVSTTEMSFRNLLTKILTVRPRTKEFLFGYPLLILGLSLANRGFDRWLIIFLAAGAIGEASLMNTFCHLHTPLAVSATRAVLGWVLGVVLGAVAYGIATRLTSDRTPELPISP